MLEPPRTSVIVVSRGRPRELALCLLGLSQQDHGLFEVVVVADAAGLAVAEGHPVKRVPFEEANISAARNLGLGEAAGDVVAFIDDDAVPEQTWLSRLTAPFADPKVLAAGGYVIGRNGLSFQWRASTVGPEGLSLPLDLPDDRVSLLKPPAGGAIRTEGTNCAFRAQALREIGGFDEGFRFYLDETDVSMRLAARGGLTALVPQAQVHHAFAASERRTAQRVPITLHDIGRSSMLFWRRHGAPDIDSLRRELFNSQRARLWRLVRRRKMSVARMGEALRTLAAGLEDGADRALTDLGALPHSAPGFLRFPSGPRAGKVLCGWWWQAARLRAEAREAARSQVVTLLLFSLLPYAHRMAFTDGGYWEQRGGVCGWSLRSGPRFRLARLRTRCAEETARLAPLRAVT